MRPPGLCNSQGDLPALRKAVSVDCLMKRNLFKSGADLREYRTKATGSSMLHIASYYGKMDLVKELVEQHGMDMVLEIV